MIKLRTNLDDKWISTPVISIITDLTKQARLDVFGVNGGTIRIDQEMIHYSEFRDDTWGFLKCIRLTEPGEYKNHKVGTEIFVSADPSITHDTKPMTVNDVPVVGQANETLSILSDPISAGFEALAAFFNFLCTPQGQLVAADLRTFDQQFISKLHDLFTKIHDFFEKKI